MSRLTPVLLTALCLVACGDQEIQLESGSYTLVTDVDNGEKQADPTVTLTIDLEGGTLEIAEAGTSHTVALERIDSSAWVFQCPTMHDAQLLEWVRLEGPLTLANVSFEAPVIRANCDRGSSWVVDDKFVSTGRGVQLGEEAWLVDGAPSEELAEPLDFLPSDLL